MSVVSVDEEGTVPPRLPASLEAWNTDRFLATLKAELKALESGVLPLFQATTHGGLVDDSDIAITLLHAAEDETALRLDVGVFFSEVVGGCSCGDDPVAENAYCELRIDVDRVSAVADFQMLG